MKQLAITCADRGDSVAQAIFYLLNAGDNRIDFICLAIETYGQWFLKPKEREDACINSLGQDYEKTSFGERVVVPSAVGTRYTF